MITKILSDIELDIKYSIYIEQKKLDAIKSVSGLLSQIDFNAEVVPYENPEKLTQLLISLKGNELSLEEKNIIDIIAQN